MRAFPILRGDVVPAYIGAKRGGFKQDLHHDKEKGGGTEVRAAPNPQSEIRN